MNCVLLAKMDKVFSKENKTLKNTGKLEKNTGKVREFCQSGKVGTLDVHGKMKIIPARYICTLLSELFFCGYKFSGRG